MLKNAVKSATPVIAPAYDVKRVVRTGDVRWDKTNWREAYWAIRKKRDAGELTDINLWALPNKAIDPGFTYPFGDSEVVFISGFNDPPSDWGISVFDQSKMNNAISIVVRVVFAGKSILFVDLIETLNHAAGISAYYVHYVETTRRPQVFYLVGQHS